MIDSTNTAQSSALAPLTYAWLGLVLLTLFGLGVGQWFRGIGWQPLLVAAIVWVKSWLVCRYFIESHLAHPFITKVMRAFILFAPIALILTAFFGSQFARWATL
ncbi:MAG: hypothetical protein IPP59_12025 [Betaproteobacteria bacterium]|jgi:hypothetical protein|nr:hypothetical protein [Betaproteobacteria bacterium]MBK9784836.1 hypothetical protein [Candidatus Dechloromonas phosphorivorans]